MLRCYLKTQPLKKILQSQDRICIFLIKNTKNKHSSASYWGKNTIYSFKENARTFSKNSTTQENIRISRLKEASKTYTKKNLQSRN